MLKSIVERMVKEEVCLFPKVDTKLLLLYFSVVFVLRTRGTKME